MYKNRFTIEGKVISTRPKTIVVLTKRSKKHPIYKKTFTVHKKYHAHDEKEIAKVNDMVLIKEHKPTSKLKRFVFVSIINKKNELTKKQYNNKSSKAKKK